MHTQFINSNNMNILHIDFGIDDTSGLGDVPLYMTNDV